MNVVVSSVVLEKQMEDIARQPEPTMIVDGLDHSETEEENSSACGHSRDKEGYGTTERVQQKAFQRMVVQCPDSVGDY